MYDITMPKLSDSMEVGKIIEWKVKEGDEVHEGDVLAEVESDKASMELECFHDGVMAKIVHDDGAEVPVGEAVAYIAVKDEALAEVPEAKAPPVEKPEPAPEAALAAKPAPPPRREGERIAISPYARKLAEQKGIDYTRIKGTGPGGRIVARDIEAAAAGEPAVAEKPTAKPPEKKPPAPEKKRRPLRKEIDIDPMALALAEKRGIDAAALTGTGTHGRITVDDVLAAAKAAAPPLPPSPDEELPPVEVGPEEADVEEAPFRHKTQVRIVSASKHVIPHFYMTRGADVTRLLERKDELKEKFGASITHLVMLACLKALQQVPEVNRSYDRGKIIKWKGINLGLAIDTDTGLTVAVLRNAQSLSLAQIVEQTKALVEKARAGKLSAEERRHPTFTISNLGMFDVEHFEPIINPPSAITLGVASALPAPVVRGEAIHIGRVTRLSLSCDHRIIDGVSAARFLKTLKDLLEDPDVLIGPPEPNEGGT